MGVAPVDGDTRGELLRGALREHEENTNLAKVVSSLVYSDDPFSDTGNGHITLDYVSPAKRWPQIDSSKVPAYHWASWFDGGTAAGVLTRYINYKTPIKVIIGAWNHGGTTNADPYKGRQGGQPYPSVVQQFADIKRFLEPLLRSDSVLKPERMGTIAYYTIGSNQWRTTDVWPPRGIGTTRLFFGASGNLAPERPTSTHSSDLYKVNFSATTGTHNRWHTQLGTYVDYPDRREEDKKLITYTSRALTGQVEITGSPVVAIRMKSSRPDGALFVYLEDVSPDGRVTYLTEGEQRIIFNGAAATGINYKSLGPPHSFVRAGSRRVKADNTILMSFALNPISVVLPARHRIRVAIAGADADTFERLPGDGSSLTYRVLRNRAESSYIDLPTRVEAGALP
jgi:putative CocE/NonD family hydrolase